MTVGSLGALHAGVQVSFLIMMYISVFPIAISVRTTNVYEEKSLGIYSSGEDEADDSEPSYAGAHLRRQLSFDLWYIFLGLFFVAIIEGGRIEDVKDYVSTSPSNSRSASYTASLRRLKADRTIRVLPRTHAFSRPFLHMPTLACHSAIRMRITRFLGSSRSSAS